MRFQGPQAAWERAGLQEAWEKAGLQCSSPGPRLGTPELGPSEAGPLSVKTQVAGPKLPPPSPLLGVSTGPPFHSSSLCATNRGAACWSQEMDPRQGGSRMQPVASTGSGLLLNPLTEQAVRVPAPHDPAGMHPPQEGGTHFGVGVWEVELVQTVLSRVQKAAHGQGPVSAGDRTRQRWLSGWTHPPRTASRH